MKASSVIVAVIVLMLGFPARAASAAQTFTVTSTADTGAGTLRQAILDANGNNDPTQVDTIAFNFTTGNGPYGIQPATDLPPITEPVTIDGYTQGVQTPGTPDNDARENTQSVGTNAVLKVVISRGSGFGTDLGVASPNVTIRGLVLEDAGSGIAIGGVSHVKIAGDFIGTDATGYTPTNVVDGVFVNCPARDVTIGGPALADRNVISGTTGAGVGVVGDRPCRGITIENNLVGDRPDANVRFGVPNNVGIGVATTRGGDSVLVTKNLILHNTRVGVDLIAPTNGVRVLRNSIDRNGFGIDLNDDGPTLNDATDTDNGSNRLQNFPVIRSISRTTPHTVHGVLRSRPNRRYLIQIFGGVVPNPSGFGEGAVFLRQLIVQTNGVGRASFSQPINASIDEWITATATDTGFGDTSEFSKAVQVP